ncbi:MAG: hypothetical protein F4X36_20925 [Gammaproteobacteria bacterium]|nr:hypothetical protein [Gammaproteobacteria bacterium]
MIAAALTSLTALVGLDEDLLLAWAGHSGSHRALMLAEGVALAALLYATPGVAFAEDRVEATADAALVDDEVAMRVAAPCVELLAAERMGEWRATPEAPRFTALVAIVIHGHVMAVDGAQLTATGPSERFDLYDRRVVQCYRLVHQSGSLADFNTRLWNWDISSGGAP